MTAAMLSVELTQSINLVLENIWLQISLSGREGPCPSVGSCAAAAAGLTATRWGDVDVSARRRARDPHSLLLNQVVIEIVEPLQIAPVLLHSIPAQLEQLSLQANCRHGRRCKAYQNQTNIPALLIVRLVLSTLTSMICKVGAGG